MCESCKFLKLENLYIHNMCKFVKLMNLANVLLHET
jgi:hypothetical protein